jgi:hypothetical protein
MNNTMTCKICDGTGWDAGFDSACQVCCGPIVSEAEAIAKAAVKVAASAADRDLADWLKAQTWSEFAQSLAKAHARYGSLTPKQRAAAESMRSKMAARQPKAAPVEPVELAEGYYDLGDGEVAKVVTSQAGRTYAKRLVAAKQWDYEAGLIAKLRPEMRIADRDAAAAWGRRTGICMICGTRLDNEESIARGIGPICWAKWGGA